jgi:hypothetical protein
METSLYPRTITFFASLNLLRREITSRLNINLLKSKMAAKVVKQKMIKNLEY